MTVKTSSVQIETRGYCDAHDITPAIRNAVKSAGVNDGLVTVFTPGSTAGITTIEFEPGVIEDLKRAVERLVPQSLHYDHDARWGDGNGFAHVRSSLLGPSLTVPLAGGRLTLGTWQQVILVDFDNRPRERDVVIQVMGE